MQSNMETKRPFLKVASEEFFPSTIITKGPNGSFQVGGILGTMFSAIVEYLSIDYEILRPPDGVWGAALGNGSYSGMIGMVHRGEVELALAAFSTTPSRAAVVQFSDPVYHISTALVTPRPIPKNEIDGFLKPFTSDVWLSVLLSLVAISLSVSFVAKKEMKLFDSTEKEDTLSEAIIWAVKALTQEGSEWLPRKDAGRVVVTTWLLASLVFMSSYSGILIAMLTAPKVKIPIDSVEDLVSQSEVPWRLKRPGLFSRDVLEDSSNPAHTKALMGSSGTIRSCWINREEMIAERYATICSLTTIKKVFSWDFSNTAGCHLYLARKRVYSNIIVAIAFRKNSSYIEKANTAINYLKEAGLMNLWTDQELKNTTQCMRPPSADRSRDEIAALGMTSLGGSFLVLAGGLLIASLIFLWEVTCSFCCMKEDEKNKGKVVIKHH